MEELQSILTSHQGIGFLVAAGIFFITLIFVAKRLIGFFIALLFLLFALAAGLIITNQDLVRNYIEKRMGNDTLHSTNPKKIWKKNLLQTFNDMKEDWNFEDEIAYDNQENVNKDPEYGFSVSKE